MKKLAKLAAILGVAALLFGGVLTSCYSGTDDDESTPVTTGGSSTGGTGGTGGTGSTGGSGTGGTEGTGGTGGTGEIGGTSITFDATDATSDIGKLLAGIDKKAAVTPGTYNGVTISGTATRTNSDALSVELAKSSGGTAKFTVKTGAKISITLASTGNSNTSQYKISGAGLNISDTIAGSTFTAVTGTATADGDVTLEGPGSDRGVRFQKITVTY